MARIVAWALAATLLLVGACRKTEPQIVPAGYGAMSPPIQSTAGCGARSPIPERLELVELERPAMGTRVRFLAYTSDGHSRLQVLEAFEAAFGEVMRLNDLLSSRMASSDIGRINHAGGRPVEVSADTVEILDRAIWASRVSDGAFDVTFEVLSGLWRFGDAAVPKPRLPNDTEVARLRRLIDYRRLVVNHQQLTVRLPIEMRMNLGGIAKGYAVDRAADVLRQKGLSSFLIQAGGDLLGVGHKPRGESWQSGVQDPRRPMGDYFATIELSDHAFSTAGDYARAYVLNQKRYHHILDPRTGYPAEACRSVTVWADDAFTADALDDAVFVLGPELGMTLVERTPGVGALIVDAHNRIHVSKRLQGRLSVLRQPTDAP